MAVEKSVWVQWTRYDIHEMRMLKYSMLALSEFAALGAWCLGAFPQVTTIQFSLNFNAKQIFSMTSAAK
jgi:hypothetical protein